VVERLIIVVSVVAQMAHGRKVRKISVRLAGRGTQIQWFRTDGRCVDDYVADCEDWSDRNIAHHDVSVVRGGAAGGTSIRNEFWSVVRFGQGDRDSLVGSWGWLLT